MIRKLEFRRLPSLAAVLLALAVLAATGCSRELNETTAAADQGFSKEELTAMRKSVKSLGEFRELRRIKAEEHAGTVVVKTKTVARKSKPR